MEVVSTAPISSKHTEALTARFPELKWHVFEGIEAARTALSTAEILITYGEDLTTGDVLLFEKLKWMYVISAGLEKVPLAEFDRQGVIITNARGIHAVPMAEHTLGVMLASARQTAQFVLNQSRHMWDRTIRLAELNGQTLGVVGAGAIGTEIARKARAFDMTILGLNTDGRHVEGFDRMYARERLQEMLPECDYVVVVTPLTPATRGMIGAGELAVMKNTAILINISRGPVLDTSALINALNTNRIAGACLDVFDIEPLPADSPLWGLSGVLITPHMSGRSPRYMDRALELFKRNYPAFATGRGEWVNRVNAGRGY